MISPEAINELLTRLNSESNVDLIAHQFTGLLAGIAVAVRDPEFAKSLDHDMRIHWANDHEPTERYGPAEMARIICQLSDDKTLVI